MEQKTTLRLRTSSESVTGFPGGINVNDCQGWTDASSSIGGGYFDSGAGYLTWSACNNGFSILCCD
jgi:hypothetical protein